MESMDAIAVPKLRCLRGTGDQHAHCLCIVCAHIGRLPDNEANDIDLAVFAVFDLVAVGRLPSPEAADVDDLVAGDAADVGRPSRLRGTHTHGLGIRHGLSLWQGPVSNPATSCDSDDDDDDDGCVDVTADLPAGLEARVVQHETTIGDQARRIASLHKLVAQLGGAVPPGL